MRKLRELMKGEKPSTNIEWQTPMEMAEAARMWLADDVARQRSGKRPKSKIQFWNPEGYGNPDLPEFTTNLKRTK